MKILVYARPGKVSFVWFIFVRNRVGCSIKFRRYRWNFIGTGSKKIPAKKARGFEWIIFHCERCFDGNCIGSNDLFRVCEQKTSRKLPFQFVSFKGKSNVTRLEAYRIFFISQMWWIFLLFFVNVVTKPVCRHDFPPLSSNIELFHPNGPLSPGKFWKLCYITIWKTGQISSSRTSRGNEAGTNFETDEMKFENRCGYLDRKILLAQTVLENTINVNSKLIRSFRSLIISDPDC